MSVFISALPYQLDNGRRQFQYTFGIYHIYTMECFVIVQGLHILEL